MMVLSVVNIDTSKRKLYLVCKHCLEQEWISRNNTRLPIICYMLLYHLWRVIKANVTGFWSPARNNEGPLTQVVVELNKLVQAFILSDSTYYKAQDALY